MRLVAGLVGAFAGLCALVGLVLMSQATMGVGVLAFACWMLILVRIIQASAYHHEILQALHDRTDLLRRY